MNKIDKNFLLTGNKFMPELYLGQPGFTYSTNRLFTKHCKRIQKLKKSRWLVFLSNFTICCKQKWKLIKNQLSIIEQTRDQNSIKYYSINWWNFTLIIFEMINLKWIKSITNFCWLETN